MTVTILQQFIIVATVFWGKVAPSGSTMVLLDRGDDMFPYAVMHPTLCGTVWPQFAMQVLTGDIVSHCLEERGGRSGRRLIHAVSRW